MKQIIDLNDRKDNNDNNSMSVSQCCAVTRYKFGTVFYGLLLLLGNIRRKLGVTRHNPSLNIVFQTQLTAIDSLLHALLQTLLL